MSTCPILFLIFNRPDITNFTFSRIREMQPKQLFVAADGPRERILGEDIKCKQTRELVISQVDWDCDLRLLFRGENLGCKSAVSSAITWFFQHVESGIILEDDCLPEVTFFRFCNELLDKYKDDKRIFSIGGTNVFGTWGGTNDSYMFSHQGSIWGWASWRRAWDLYDINLKDWNSPEVRKTIKELSLTDYFYEKRERTLNSSQENHIDTWDYQWLYTRLKYRGLTILPKENQISNLGFNEFATHTKNSNAKLSNIKTFPLSFPLSHPSTIELNQEFEMEFLTYLHEKKENEKTSLPFHKKLKRRIRNLFF